MHSLSISTLWTFLYFRSPCGWFIFLFFSLFVVIGKRNYWVPWSFLTQSAISLVGTISSPSSICNSFLVWDSYPVVCWDFSQRSDQSFYTSQLTDFIFFGVYQWIAGLINVGQICSENIWQSLTVKLQETFHLLGTLSCHMLLLVIMISLSNIEFLILQLLILAKSFILLIILPCLFSFMQIQ